jgi:hypothetical protein
MLSLLSLVFIIGGFFPAPVSLMLAVGLEHIPLLWLKKDST